MAHQRIVAPVPCARPAAERISPHARQDGHRRDAAAASPDLEVVDVPPDSSFKAWAHGYPFRTVRWHFHPEYEIHLVTETSGRSFIGNYIGSFRPGNLVLVGPNLPHNWISDIEKGTTVARRGLVVQFTDAFIRSSIALLPELRPVSPLLEAASGGLEFAEPAGGEALGLMEALVEATGPERIGLFFRLLALLQRSDARRLASASYRPSPERYAAEPLNHVLDHIARNLSTDLRQSELAELSGYTAAAFSRAFRRHAGTTFVRHVNRLRIERACELLINGRGSVADICFAVGFNNLSNFNRHFAAMLAMPPSRFRHMHRENVRSGRGDSALSDGLRSFL